LPSSGGESKTRLTVGDVRPIRVEPPPRLLAG